MNDYHSRPEFGSGATKRFRREGSVAFYWRHIARRVSDEQSDAMRRGSLLDTLVQCALDGKPPKDAIAVTPNEIGGEPVNLRLKAHREYVATITEEAARAGRITCTADELSAAYRQCELIDKLLVRGYSQVPFYAGNFKALIDVWRGPGDTWTDLKTTRFHTAEAFWNDAQYLGYPWQCAHYAEVTGNDQCELLWVSNCEPWVGGIITIDASDLEPERGRVRQTFDEIDELMDEQEHCDRDINGIPTCWLGEYHGAPVSSLLLETRG